MPITTILKSETYLTDCTQILSEFISDYADDVDIVFYQPILEENTVLDRDILFLELRDELGRTVGMGDSIGYGKKGEEQSLSFWAWWITQNGVLNVTQKAQRLKMAFLQHKDVLAMAKLRNAKISSFRPIQGSPFCGGRQLITFQIMLEWS